MSVASPPDPAREVAEAFDLTLPSPLPVLPPADALVRDSVAESERAVQEADDLDDLEARTRTRLANIDAWWALDAIAPALEAARQASLVIPDNPEVLSRLASLLSRTGLHREAAEAYEARARLRRSGSSWASATRAWLRADDLAAAERAVSELLLLAPVDPRTSALGLTVARLRAVVAGDPRLLIPKLLEAAVQARDRGDLEVFRAHALDAWLTSQGASGGELLGAALVSVGNVRVAVSVLVESAARALPRADGATATRVLLQAAKVAVDAGLASEAVSLRTVLALVPSVSSGESREALRDLLAEHERPLELAMRLRADARHAVGSARAAAWKGIAAIELPYDPASAAEALVEALRHDPEDAEAVALLTNLAEEPGAEPAIRDALSLAAKAPGQSAAFQVRLLRWLGQLEEQAGDPASALRAYRGIASPDRAVRDAIARVEARGRALLADAAAALGGLEGREDDPPPHLLAELLNRFASTPGAFGDMKSAARVLGAAALHDERFATLWLKVTKRSGDPAQVLTALRRIATRCGVPAARVKAAIECAAWLDARGDATTEAAEILELLLDEMPTEREAAVALAALAERTNDPRLTDSALRALARTARDPRERDILGRFAGAPSGPYAVYAACLSEPTASRERTEHLGRLHELVGDTHSLLAQRTRALLAKTSPQDDGLAIARRFALYDPDSAEATIAWFGAACLAGVADQIAEAAVAVSRSAASARDVAAVARTAITRLGNRGASPACVPIVLAAAAAVGLADKALRAAVTELAERHAAPAEAVTLHESVFAAASDQLAERLGALRRLAGAHRAAGNIVGEAAALRRIQALTPNDEESLARLTELLPRTGDRAGLARLLSLRLASVLDPSARRRLHLAIVASLAAASPPRLDEALEALDRYVQERHDDDSRGEAVRVMLALGRADAAVERLARWSLTAHDHEAVTLASVAARLAHERLHDGAKALATIRAALPRTAHAPELVLLAERIATESGALEAMLGIYQDLSAASAGEHGRHAIAYRRAAFLERVGDHEEALTEHLALLDRYPSLGATFTAIERLAERTDRYDFLVRALGVLAAAAPAAETRARYYLRASEVAGTRGKDRKASLDLALRAFQAWPGTDTESAVLELLEGLKTELPEPCRRALEALSDHSLGAGNQTWDDDERRRHALHAAEHAIAAEDTYRLAASVALFFRGHEHPESGRREVLALLDRLGATPALRTAAEAVPSMASSRESPRPAARIVSLGDDLAPDEAPPDEPLPSEPEGPPLDATKRSSERPPEAPPPASEVTAEGAQPVPAPEASPPVSLDSLREAAERGDDAAAASLADRLAQDPATADEALALQRRRFGDDPTRLDALEAMVLLYTEQGMTSEGDALRSVLAPLRGQEASAVAPDLLELAEPLDGVTRVLFPPRFASFAELGTQLWEALGARYRRDQLKFELRPRASVPDDLARMFSAALRLLQLPRATTLVVNDEARDGAQSLPGQPPSVAVATILASDTPLARYAIGRALEGTRTCHALIACLSAEEGHRLVQAVLAAFGSGEGVSLAPGVARLANTLQESLTPRAQHRVEELVEELGQRLSYAAWRDAVELARMRAGMLLCGDFDVAASQVLASQRGGVGEPARGLVTSGALRELARFAASEEYLLLRWTVDPATRRRR